MDPCPTCPIADIPGMTCLAVRRNSPHECRLAATREDAREDLRRRTMALPPPPERKLPQIQPNIPPPPPPPVPRSCVYFGEPAIDAAGTPILRDCQSCRGTVRLKVFDCSHPGHVANPTTTLRACSACKDFTPVPPMPPPEETAVTDMGGLPVKMVAPGDKRPVWRGGIIQIMVGRACDESCFHCTQGSDLAGKPALMTPDQFEAAVDSLDGYWGVYGVFGGNPCLNPHFGTFCEILRAKVAWEQRGLWCNHPRGKGALCRITFNPKVSNLNCHLSGEAHGEFSRDWPEAIPYLKGMDQDSIHGPPFVAMKDVEPDEAKRWEMIGSCDINKYWSALLGVVPGRGLRAYACEIAYAQAALHATAEDAADWPDTGMEAVPGWWKRPMADFEAQVRLHCHSCGIPLRRPGQLAVGGEKEEFSETHRAIARPKVKGRPVEFVGIGGMIERGDRPSTQYLPNVTPGYRA